MHADKERFVRVEDIFSRVGSAVLMAALTTFLAGTSMYPSGLVSFCKMGHFLMLVMFVSYAYATFFFVPMCAIFGPTKNFGKLNLKKLLRRVVRRCCRRGRQGAEGAGDEKGDVEREGLKVETCHST
jgi:predicted RND superfamily exporter protein